MKAEKGWVYLEGECRYTRNPDIIRHEVRRLHQERTWVDLRHPGYRSVPTVITGTDGKIVEIDRPRDWEPVPEVLLTYQRPREPWHFMKADVKEVTARSVRIHLPHTLTVFERREFFRVEVPAGSSVVIQYVSGGTAARLSGDLADLSGQGYVLDGEVVDVSLGGVAFETTPLPDIPLPSVGTRIHPVTLHLAAGPGGAPDLIRISEATVVKLRKRGDQPRARIALRFSATEEETEALAAYIRRRELAILKAAQEA